MNIYDKYIHSLLLYPKINEATINDLVDLSVRGLNPFDPKRISYKGISPKSKTIHFKTGKYTQKVRIPEYTHISRLKGEYTEKVELALHDEIKVYCNCKDFLYSGAKYMAWQLDYGIHKENRPPDIRNPKLEGTVCKHLTYLLNNIDKYIVNIAKDFYLTRKTRKTKMKK